MASLNIPYVFTNGTPANATEVNADLTAVKTFVDAQLVQIDGSVKAPTVAIADDAITSAKIAANAVGTSEIANDAVTADKVLDGETLPVNITGNAATATSATTAASATTAGSATTAASATTAVDLNNGAGYSTSWTGSTLNVYANPLVSQYALQSNGGFYEVAPTTGSASTQYYVWRSSDGKLVTRSGTSLRDHKNNIADVEDGLQKINALRPRTFNFKEDYVDMEDPQSIHDLIEQTQIGFVVEEVLAVSDDLITYDYGPNKQLAPKMWKENAVISLAVKAIQELSAKVDALEAKVAELEAK